MEQISRAPSLDEERERLLPKIKQFRQDVDALINRTEFPKPNEESSGKEIVPNDYRTLIALNEVRVNLIQAKMWAGKMLEYLGNPFPPELADKAR